MTLAPGAVLGGRYHIRELCGRGAMAEVWAASDAASGGAEVAVKVMDAMDDDPDLALRFEREARAVGRIDSPYVCRLLDVGRGPGGLPFLVLERLYGETLESRIAREQVLSAGAVHDLLAEILVGLAAAHRVGIIHRDLKPSNVFLAARTGEAPTCKLLDFGVSKIVRSDPTGWEPVLTTEHTTLGSMAFMAPEQIGGSSSVDARADLYAAGVIGYRALTGRLPFSGSSLQAVMALKSEQEPPTLEEATGRSWPPPLVQLFRHVLARDPSARWQTAEETAAACASAFAAARGAPFPALADLRAGAEATGAHPTETLPGRRGGGRPR